ncbi:hypothetical protein [Fervidobacterium thailandense]|uniref:Uncharacterized protein n=1 Tax=Fervidobacterium thailandense TaxID=1008305 RepID=A0A1E3G4Y5_9BACT|nr:hypothetical protein [Fervidobacterium thailandense]ODN30903.1 hypothetical protein A4H02_03310 [Fervidobacterium thailandense]
MVEPVSGIQNQTIVLRVSHESSHISSLQQYMAQAAIAHSAQQVAKRAQEEMNAPRNVERSQDKRTRTATDGRSQGYTAAYSSRQGKERSKEEVVSQNSSHILDVRV